MLPAKKRAEESRIRLRLHADEDVYKLDLGRLTHGRDGFLTELAKRIGHYRIPCAGAGRDLIRARPQMPRK